MDAEESREILRMFKADSAYLYRYGSLGETLDRFNALTEQEKRILLCLALQKGDHEVKKVASFLMARLEPPAGNLNELKKQLSSWGKPTLKKILREWDRPKKAKASTPPTTITLNTSTNEELLQALKKKDVKVRWTAARLLGERRYEGAVKALIKSLNDDEQMVRSNAIWALGNIGDPKATEPLLKILNNPNYKERGFAAGALVQIEGKKAIGPLIGVLKGKDLDLRRSASIALSTIRGEHLIEPLLEVLQEEDPEIKWRVASILGKTRDTRAIEPLINLLKDKDSRVQESAAKGLAELTGQNLGIDYHSWENWWSQQQIRKVFWNEIK